MKKSIGNQMSLPNLQQGDVILRGIASLPAKAKAKPGRAIVAYGEVTGHMHEVIGSGVEVYELNGTIYVSAPAGGTIRHEEHRPITLPPGNYEIGIVKEYDHFMEEARNVAD
jgi:hypothetical protein